MDNYSPIDNPELKKQFSDLGVISHYGDLSFLSESSSSTSQSTQFLDIPITRDEVSYSIRNSKMGKSPGEDGIPYEILKKFSGDIIAWITDFYNLVIQQGRVPVDWTIYKVILIPKPNSNSFRPISISSSYLKILEKIICDRINWFIESRSAIPKNFYRFRYGKSCQDCFAVLRTDIDISKAKNHYMGIIFVDIKSAFNHVNLEILLKNLVNIGIFKKIALFIHNIMIERTLVGYSAGAEIGIVKTNTGCPQGSVFSLLLFNIYISKLNEAFTHEIKAIGFADDVNFYASHENLQTLKEVLKDNLERFKGWLEMYGIELAIYSYLIQPQLSILV